MELHNNTAAGQSHHLAPPLFNEKYYQIHNTSDYHQVFKKTNRVLNILVKHSLFLW